MREQYVVVGELLSYEPYGIMFAKDDAPLAAVVDAQLAPPGRQRVSCAGSTTSGSCAACPGARLGLPMSMELERSFEVLGLPTD